MSESVKSYKRDAEDEIQGILILPSSLKLENHI